MNNERIFNLEKMACFSGQGEHQSQILHPGEVAIAEKDQVHGAINHSQENAIFVSIYSAPQIGYQPKLG
ncbi:MAG: hypothetical protein ACKN9E_12805 [Microcystaceae cyanobacterium]